MKYRGYCEYHVRLAKDRKTGQTVAEIPTLEISDYGPDTHKALERLEKMVAFHLECLLEEGKPIPKEKRTKQGFYLKVKRPVGAP